MINSTKLKEIKLLIQISDSRIKYEVEEPNDIQQALIDNGLAGTKSQELYQDLYPDKYTVPCLCLTPKGAAYLEMIQMVDLPEPRTVYTSNVAVLNADTGEPCGLVIID